MNTRGYYGRPRIGEIFPGLREGVSAVADAFRHVLPQDHPDAIDQAPSADADAYLRNSLSTLQGEIGALGQMLSTLASAGRLSKALDAFYKSRWLPFYNNWQRFYDSVHVATLTSATLPVIAAQLQTYRSQWNAVHGDAQRALVASGAPGAGPAVPPPGGSAGSPPMASPPDEPDHYYALWAAGGLGLVALISFAFAARGAT